MKKVIMPVLGIPLAFGIIVIFATCLSPIDFVPDNSGNTNITGTVDTNDISSAILMLTNRSKTVDVTKVSITQPEWTPPEGNANAQPPSVSFTNQPKRLEKKAQYLAPSDKSYRVVIDYAFDAWKNTPAGTGTRTLLIPLPQARQIVEYVIYRNADGVVFVDSEAMDPDPADTGNPVEDILPGEGSSPAVIPPEGRNRMATLIVINKSTSQIIDGVNFRMKDADYTMGSIGTKDKQSIALGQGSWVTHLTYTRNGVEKTLGPINSVVVPSNDPQSIQEHYLYFYLNNRGEYAMSPEWPPNPNDAEEEDLLPPDNGYGRGLIKIVNNSSALAETVTIQNLRDTDISPLIISYINFNPAVPVQYNRTGYVDVIGTEEFPIDAHDWYLIQITLGNSQNVGTVERKAYIKDQMVTIVISMDDLRFDNARGAKVTLTNKTNDWPVDIVSLTVQSKANTYQNSFYDVSTWEPMGSIDKNQSAVMYVMSSTAMPITPGTQFEAQITIQGYGIVAIINKNFNPAELYSESSPDRNVRTIMITDADVPEIIRNAYINAKGAKVTLENKVASWPVEIIGMKVQNKANPGESSFYGTNNWKPQGAVGNGQNVEQIVTSSTDMPIRPGVEFEAAITIHGSGRSETITKTFSPAELFSDNPPEHNTRTITITDSDVPESIKDAFIYTRGAKVTIVNKVGRWPVQIIGMTVQDRTDTSKNTFYRTTDWEPQTMIGNNQSAVQMVRSSAAMPIRAGIEFEAVIHLFGNGQQGTVTKVFDPAALYSDKAPELNTRTITITDSDVPNEVKEPEIPTIVGAKVILENKVSNWPVEIIGLTVRNKTTTTESLSYTVDDWTQRGAIDRNGSATLEVLSSQLMPITTGAKFEARVILHGSGRTETITKAFSPEELYSVYSLNQNTRTITITDSDVPQSIKDAYIYTRGAHFTLENKINSWSVQIIGMTVRNKDNPSENTVCNDATWEPHILIGKNQSVTQMVMSSTAMPMTPTAEFEAIIFLFGNGQTASITKAINPALLYSTLTPERNTRTVTITDSDVPDEVKTPTQIQPPVSNPIGANVTIRNNVSSWPVQVIGMMVRNRAANSQSSSYGINDWVPSGVIDNAQSAEQLVLSTMVMPIAAGAKFEARITLSGSGKIETITKAFDQEELYSLASPDQNPRTIIITDSDVPQSIKDAYIYTRGAKVTILNQVSAKWPVQVIGMMVRNRANSNESTFYSDTTWEPKAVIGNNKNAVQLVKSSAAMPIKAGVQFEAVIYLIGNNQQGTVVKNFSPAVLYSDLAPEQNPRTITITDSDIPDQLKKPDIPTIIGAKVMLENKISNWPVQIMSVTVRNKAKPGESTAYGVSTWVPYGLIDKSRSAVQTVISSTAMPMTTTAEFEAEVTLFGGGITAPVIKAFIPAVLYSDKAPEQNTRTITISDNDVPDLIKDAYIFTRGAKMTLENKVNTWPIQITGMTIRNRSNTGESADYDSATWEPNGLINNDGTVNQMVKSTAAMPIKSGATFEARITLYGNGQSATITKYFSPATLYSELAPEQNTRTITITDNDIPIELRTPPPYSTEIPELDGSVAIGKTVSIDGYEWYVVEKTTIGDKTYAMLVCKKIMAYGVMFNDPRNSDYNESRLQAKMTELYDTKMVLMKKIAVLPSLGNNSQTYATQPTTTMADTVIKDVFFALTCKDVHDMGDNAHRYGLIHWWTRSPVDRESAWEVNPDGVVGENVTNATGIGAVPGVWVRIE